MLGRLCGDYCCAHPAMLGFPFDASKMLYKFSSLSNGAVTCIVSLPSLDVVGVGVLAG